MISQDDKGRLKIDNDFFVVAEQRFEALGSLFERGSDSIVGALLNEASVRFRQISLCHAEVQSHALLYWHAFEEFNQAKRPDPGYHYSEGAASALRLMRDIETRLKVFLESFYIFSFRIIEITRRINYILFKGKEMVDEPTGIIFARNKLILHPEQVKLGPILNTSLKLSLPFDITMKEGRRPGESNEFQDQGFRHNSDKFRDFLLAWATSAESRLRATNERSVQ